MHKKITGMLKNHAGEKYKKVSKGSISRASKEAKIGSYTEAGASYARVLTSSTATPEEKESAGKSVTEMMRFIKIQRTAVSLFISHKWSDALSVIDTIPGQDRNPTIRKCQVPFTHRGLNLTTSETRTSADGGQMSATARSNTKGPSCCCSAHSKKCLSRRVEERAA